MDTIYMLHLQPVTQEHLRNEASTWQDNLLLDAMVYESRTAGICQPMYLRAIHLRDITRWLDGIGFVSPVRADGLPYGPCCDNGFTSSVLVKGRIL